MAFQQNIETTTLEQEAQAERLHEETRKIKEQAITEGKLIYAENGDFQYALAPNGAKSNLNEQQWIQTRTSFFRNWFGDWENSPETASKLVDANGEPMIFYHGTTRPFDSFSHEAPKVFGEIANVTGAFYLTSSRAFAEKEYGKFKETLIIDILRRFNEQFFDEKETEWDALIDKWNDFIRSIGTERVDLRRQIPDGRGGMRDFTMVEFDGKEIFPTNELIKLWDGTIPDTFLPEEYAMDIIDDLGDKKMLLPKNSRQIIMSLFVNARHPRYKNLEGRGIQEMDELFAEGMIEKGRYAFGPTQTHIGSDPAFGSMPEIDAIVVKAQSGNSALAVFEPNQVKSAEKNTGLFTDSSDNIYE